MGAPLSSLLSALLPSPACLVFVEVSEVLGIV